MEKRKFGNTGLETSILGFGGFHLLEIPSIEAEYLLNRYLDAGGNYIETAASYGDGESELKIGKVMATRRKECILVTKTGKRDSQGCIDSLESSLKRLQTDYVDMLLMHGVASLEELDTILAPGGALEGALELKRQGRVRHIGLSMHGQPDVLIKALNSYLFEAVMTTVNYYDSCNFPEIEDKLLPLAQSKGTAIIIMKPLADGLLWKSPEKAFKYAFSQPASVIVTGMNTREMLEKDLEYANNFVPMTQEEKEELLKNAEELGNYVCRQCGQCVPCPEGVPITEIFRLEGYFDRQMRDGVVRNASDFALRDRLRFWFKNKDMAVEKYTALPINAEKCTECGKCIPKCRYGIDIIGKLKIADYKLAAKKIY